MNEPVIPPTFEIVWAAVGVIAAALMVFALITIARSKSVTSTQRVLWVLAVLILPGIGAATWLVTTAVERRQADASPVDSLIE